MKIALTITKETESEILRKAPECKNGHTIQVTDTKGQNISIVGAKKGGIEGGAIISLKNHRGIMSRASSSTTETKYVAKVMFGDNNIQGSHYLASNAKSVLRSWWSRRTLEEINTSVVQEFAALKLAKILNPNIVPDAKLGCVKEDGGKERFFLMTKVAGQKEGEKFETFDKASQAEVPKDIWQSAFAISVGLLNDQDVNKGDNIGVVFDAQESKRLCLFDLGHPTPDKFELTPKTYLPQSTNLLADVLLWLINLFVSANNLPLTFTMVPDIEKQLSPQERKEALEMVLKKKGEIFQELDNMVKRPSSDHFSQQAILDLKNRIENRMAYLENLLHPTTESGKHQTKSTVIRTNVPWFL
ncbi:MAG: hypothetical protein LBB17_00070 [Puniceicoccales bacterium]|jgi:hypothetical protein|nr:hypothetical protein [Puniceicoccales bacterium]